MGVGVAAGEGVGLVLGVAFRAEAGGVVQAILVLQAAEDGR
ncbi:hypothetical protein [Nonomuraea sp. NPDC050310]